MQISLSCSHTRHRPKSATRGTLDVAIAVDAAPHSSGSSNNQERLQRLADAHKFEPNGVAVPRVNILTVNYRTHNGILACAAGIVDLIYEFFPGSIDLLPRETGFFQGPKPILLSETKVDDAAVLIVGSDRKASQIEFGAHQVGRRPPSSPDFSFSFLSFRASPLS